MRRHPAGVLHDHQLRIGIAGDRDVATDAAVHGLGHQVVVRVLRTLVPRRDGGRAAVGSSDIRKEETPAVFTGWLEAIGQANVATDAGEGFLTNY